MAVPRVEDPDSTRLPDDAPNPLGTIDKFMDMSGGVPKLLESLCFCVAVPTFFS